MANSTWEVGRRRTMRRLRAFLSGRMPVVITFGCLILVNWAVAFWLIRYTYQEREATATQMLKDEAQYSAQRISNLFEDADQILLDLRARYPSEDLSLALGRWTAGRNSGGIALIAPDGRVMATSPHANTAGWPRLMTRLAASADVLAIGEPTQGKNGHLGSIPVARRMVQPDGSFSGILMYAVESDALLSLSPSITALDGCMALLPLPSAAGCP